MAKQTGLATGATGARVFDEHDGTVTPVANVPALSPAPAQAHSPITHAPKTTATATAASHPVSRSATAEGTPGRYLVSLSAATPLAHQTLEVDASTADEAKAKFNAANGISGSDHTYTVTRL